MTDTSARNRYLEGNFAPVREEVTVTDLAGDGHDPRPPRRPLPAQRPEPGRRPRPRDATTGSSAPAWCTACGSATGGPSGTATGGCARGEVAEALGEQPRPGPIHAGFDFAANTNVIGHAGRTFAIVEAGGRPYELTDELDTVGPVRLRRHAARRLHRPSPRATPPPASCTRCRYFFGWGNKVQYSVIGTDGRVRRTVDIEVSGSPMMHDFSLTDGPRRHLRPAGHVRRRGGRGVAPRSFRRPATAMMSASSAAAGSPSAMAPAMLRQGGSAASPTRGTPTTRPGSA